MSIELSIVSPVYRAEAILPQLIDRLVKAVSDRVTDYEIILVEDSSPDASWSVILSEARKNPKIKGIRLSRNFGQHPAIMAGLQAAKGEWIVVMDCDLQDRPEEIPKMLEKARSGYSVVAGLRINRQDSFLKKAFSILFYGFLSYLTETKQDYRIANFGVYSRAAIQAVLSMTEPFKFFPVMIRWVGFRSTTVEIEHAERTIGVTSYDFKKLRDLAYKLATAYSDKPLRLIVKFGFFISSITMLMSIVYLYRYWMGEITVPGFTSLILSVSFFSGLIISVLGVVGLYVARTFETTKQRPVFLIEERTD